MNTSPHPDPSPSDRFSANPLSRRSALAALAGLGATAVLAACGSSSKSAATASSAASSSTAASTSTAGTTATTTAATTATVAGTATTSAATSATAAASTASLTEIPEETAGPFPGDGSNGKNALTLDGVVRQDITSSFAGATGVAKGVPLTVKFMLTDTAGTPLVGKGVYIWHCDRDGNYSMYSNSAVNENYLRGVQPSDSAGKVTFTTIFPAAYTGRWPHIHFEVYDSVADATSGGKLLATSQIALPQATCQAVYATDGYSASIANLAQDSLSTDMVFGDDGGVHELATITGTVSAGLTAELAVPI